MANFASSESVILKNVRATWLDIFEPGAGMNGGPAKYKFTGLFEPASENAEICRKAMREAAAKLWGGNADNMIRSMGANSKALRDGNNKLADDGTPMPAYQNMLYISASAKVEYPPRVVGPRKHEGKFVVLRADGRGFVGSKDVTDELGYELRAPYRGCYVNVQLRFTAGKQFTSSSGSVIPNQIFARLEALQFRSDGEPFGVGPVLTPGFDEEAVSSAEGNDLFEQ